jgi:hypothetical protein
VTVPAELLETLGRWYDAPLEFDEVFPDRARDAQIPFLEAVGKNRSVAWRGPRSSDKSNTVARATLWFFTTREDSLVLILTPFHQQGHVWREIQNLWRSSAVLQKLYPGVEILEGEIRMRGRPLWRVLLRSAESGEAIEGAHAPGGTLIAFDEAKLIGDDAYASALGSLGDDPDSRWIAVSTAAATGWFARAFREERDHWDATFSNTYLDIPRLHARGEQMKRVLGEHSVAFRSQWLCEPASSNERPFFDARKIEQAINRPIEPSGARILSCDIARLGSDRTALCLRHGNKVERFYTLRPADLMETSGSITALLRAIRDPKVSVAIVDQTGLGAGVLDRLREVFQETGIGRFVRLVGFQGGMSAEDSDAQTLFANRKTESAARLREALDKGQVSLPDHRTMLAELFAFEERTSSNGKARIEDGAGRSPDYGDSLVMSWSVGASGQGHVSLKWAPFVVRSPRGPAFDKRL